MNSQALNPTAKGATCPDLVNNILANDLCSSCGACVGICPTDALTIYPDQSYMPVLDEAKCKPGCGLCYMTCPGNGYPVVKWSEELMTNGTEWHKEYGPVRRYWRGISTDPEIRKTASTGGIATALMLYLLATKQVEDVGVVVMENDLPVVKLTHDPEVVKSAVGSKYGPAPMMEIFADIKKRPRKFAMTTVGCQMGAWMRATEHYPHLRDCLVLSIGLYCGQVKAMDHIKYIAKSVGIDYPKEAEFLGWRQGSYPGHSRFRMKATGEIVDKQLYGWLDLAVPYFSLNLCQFCPDAGNFTSDITLGDDHTQKKKETITVCRTEKGERLMTEARDAGWIEFKDMDMEDVERTVIRYITRSKLFPANVRGDWKRKKGEHAPQFDYDLSTLIPRAFFIHRRLWILKYKMYMWVRRGLLNRILLSNTTVMERVGHFIYYFPGTLPGFKIAVRAAKGVRFILRKVRRPVPNR